MATGSMENNFRIFMDRGGDRMLPRIDIINMRLDGARNGSISFPIQF